MTIKRELERGKTGFDKVVRSQEERLRVYSPSASEVADLLMLSTSRESGVAEEKPVENRGSANHPGRHVKSARQGVN